jgi:copper(I)-binding protein
MSRLSMCHSGVATGATVMPRRMVWAVLAGLLLPGAASAHGFSVGQLTIDHPYATPSRPGLATGAVYFRAIRNNGKEPDQLLSARTPVADTVELHRMDMTCDVMRMRAVPAIDLPATTEVRLRHGTANGHHLMLLGLKAPLKDGDRFPVTLTFQRAGEREVMVWVQTPRRAGKADGHQH